MQFRVCSVLSLFEIIYHCIFYDSGYVREKERLAKKWHIGWQQIQMSWCYQKDIMKTSFPSQMGEYNGDMKPKKKKEKKVNSSDLK